MKLNFFLLTSLLVLLGERSKAITTPQKYCASLPAVSCEVLNIEVRTATTGSYPLSVTIKYCRNKTFGTVFYSGQSDVAGSVNFAEPGQGSTGGIKMDGGSLCAAPSPSYGNKFLP